MRAAVIGSVAVTGAVAAALGLVFWVLLEPVVPDPGCNTSLQPGAYRDAMLPAHLASLVALCGAAAWLDARTAPDRRVPRWTRLALGAVAVLAALWLLVPAVAGGLGVISVFAAPLLGVPLLIVLAVRTVLALRRGGDRAWGQHAVTARVLVWGAITLGLPAHVAYAWLNGASAFCF
jgi:hypothetical protein